MLAIHNRDALAFGCCVSYVRGVVDLVGARVITESDNLTQHVQET